MDIVFPVLGGRSRRVVPAAGRGNRPEPVAWAPEAPRRRGAVVATLPAAYRSGTRIGDGNGRAVHRSALALGMWLASWSVPTPAVICPGQTSHSQTCTLNPAVASGSEEFENVANTLRPGDELVLRGGTYSQTGRRAVTAVGSATQPIVIRAFEGESPLLTRPLGDYSQNNIEIVNSSYLTIRGLRFQGGSTGVRFIGGDHVTLEDSEIFDTGNNALSANSGDTDALTVRRNHIHHTGLDTAGTTEGEGMYLGCNDNSCRITNSVIEDNYIHDLRGTSDGGNDGVEVKVGSGGNIIRNNVIHDTTIGRRYPCIFVYGGGTNPNVVEGNAMWNCGEAIQVAADAVIRNNLILDSDVGITAAPHAQVAQVRNVTITHNTIAGHDTCLGINWSGATGMVLANNAVYCPNATAVSASGLGGAGVVASANRVEGGMSGASIDGVRFLAGGSASSVFGNPADRDYWPAAGSVLLGTADSAYAAAQDFNESARSAPYDVGAYETEGLSANPGWRVVAGFKGEAPVNQPPSISFSADPTGVSVGGQSRLSWSVTGADSCQAAGAWSGARPVVGSEDTAALSASSRFTLNCRGAGGDATSDVTVTVIDSPGGGGTVGASGGGCAAGNGAFDPLLPGLAAVALGYCLRRRHAWDRGSSAAFGWARAAALETTARPRGANREHAGLSAPRYPRRSMT